MKDVSLTFASVNEQQLASVPEQQLRESSAERSFIHCVICGEVAETRA